ncbi:MAG TPA: hypothetical protein VIH69_04190 [Dehalococcoidia bacterium]
MKEVIYDKGTENERMAVHYYDDPEEEHVSFWDRKIKVDPFTGALIEIFSGIFFGLLKCFLFFLEAYPKALKEVEEEERIKREKKVTSLPR